MDQHGLVGWDGQKQFCNACEERVGAWWAWDACTWCRHCTYSLAWRGDMNVWHDLGCSFTECHAGKSGCHQFLLRLCSVS